MAANPYGAGVLGLISLPKTSKPLSSSVVVNKGDEKRPRRKSRRKGTNGDVLISAVVSSYLLTHLHHVLQRAEYGASKEGRSSHAANFAGEFGLMAKQ